MSDSHNAETTMSDNHNAEAMMSDSHNAETTMSDNHNAETTMSDNHNAETTMSDSHNVETMMSDSHNVETMMSDSHNAETTMSDSHNAETTMSDSHNAENFIRMGGLLINEYLNFNYDNSPFWHEGKETDKKIDDMLREVSDFHLKNKELDIDEDKFIDLRDKFILQMSKDEDVGIQDEKTYNTFKTECLDQQCSDSPVQRTKQETETANMLLAFRRLQELREEGEGEMLLTEGLVSDIHAVLLKDLPCDHRGELSKNVRFARDLKDPKKIMIYPHPPFVEKMLRTLLDYSNFMLCYLKHELVHGDTYETIKIFIKFCAWFFYNFINLHPFGDGNGRMSRLLCYYLQSIFVKLPVATYNVFAPSSRKDYLEAISRARERSKQEIERLPETDECRQNNWVLCSEPKELASMILECLSYTCEEYYSRKNTDLSDDLLLWRDED